VLFGGREFPERPLVIRLLIAVAVLYWAWPMIKPGVGFVLEGFGVKMPARQVEAFLDQRAMWATAVPAHEQRTRCEPGTGNWDYVCKIAYAPRGVQKPLRKKIGVRVGSGSIQRISRAHELSDPVIRD
jgi:hypothetical protein